MPHVQPLGVVQQLRRDQLCVYLEPFEVKVQGEHQERVPRGAIQQHLVVDQVPSHVRRMRRCELHLRGHMLETVHQCVRPRQRRLALTVGPRRGQLAQDVRQLVQQRKDGQPPASAHEVRPAETQHLLEDVVEEAPLHLLGPDVRLEHVEGNGEVVQLKTKPSHWAFIELWPVGVLKHGGEVVDIIRGDPSRLLQEPVPHVALLFRATSHAAHLC
mmetsp:Transcript_36697/g.94727  ORF Transcript_36697/g.94727 Transcript_36697/m.94727 type:complete len:215 (+) Transcript_36697:152-796(+)